MSSDARLLHDYYQALGMLSNASNACSSRASSRSRLKTCRGPGRGLVAIIPKLSAMRSSMLPSDLNETRKEVGASRRNCGFLSAGEGAHGLFLLANEHASCLKVARARRLFEKCLKHSKRVLRSFENAQGRMANRAVRGRRWLAGSGNALLRDG